MQCTVPWPTAHAGYGVSLWSWSDEGKVCRPEEGGSGHRRVPHRNCKCVACSYFRILVASQLTSQNYYTTFTNIVERHNPPSLFFPSPPLSIPVSVPPSLLNSSGSLLPGLCADESVSWSCPPQRPCPQALPSAVLLPLCPYQ